MLHQIREEDLQTLESELPAILQASHVSCNDPITRKRWEIVRQVITNVHWNYGPPSQAERVEPEDDEP